MRPCPSWASQSSSEYCGCRVDWIQPTQMYWRQMSPDQRPRRPASICAAAPQCSNRHCKTRKHIFASANAFVLFTAAVTKCACSRTFVLGMSPKIERWGSFAEEKPQWPGRLQSLQSDGDTSGRWERANTTFRLPAEHKLFMCHAGCFGSSGCGYPEGRRKRRTPRWGRVVEARAVRGRLPPRWEALLTRHADHWPHSCVCSFPSMPAHRHYQTGWPWRHSGTPARLEDSHLHPAVKAKTSPSALSSLSTIIRVWQPHLQHGLVLHVSSFAPDVLSQHHCTGPHVHAILRVQHLAAQSITFNKSHSIIASSLSVYLPKVLAHQYINPVDRLCITR